MERAVAGYESLSDYELFCLFATDGGAFDAYCRKRLPALYWYAQGACEDLGVPSNLARDFVHECLVKTLETLAEDEWKPPRAATSYLRKAIFNKIVDWQRREARAHYVDEYLPGIEPATPETDSAAEELATALDLLNCLDREIIELHLVKKMNFEDIGRYYGISKSAANKRFGKAAERFVAMYQEHTTAARDHPEGD